MPECGTTAVPTSPAARRITLLAAIAAVSAGAAAAQGVAVTSRTARGSPLAQTDLPPPEVRFVDVARESGLDFRHVLGNPHEKEYILETTGSGVAIFDFDDDGLPDVFLVNGRGWTDPAPDQAPTSRLFRNLGDLRFEDVTEATGLARSGWGQGTCVGDFNNDGFDDLYVTHYGPDVLYRNVGGKRFLDFTAEAGMPTHGRRWGTGCAFVDYDRDGWLDIAVANYVDLDLKRTPRPGESNFCRYKGLAVLCGPRGLPGESNLLYRNVRGERFEDVSEESGFAGPGGRYGLGVLTLDFDTDGWTDIYVAADSTPSMLFHNQGDGTFDEVGLLSGTSLNGDGQEQAGMGVSAADFNHDGRVDIVKTNFSDDVPSLYRNEGRGFFTDVSYRAGLGVHTNYLGWGVGFVDVDHDGWKDLFVVNGHVYPSIDELESASPYRQARLLFWNIRNGAFLDVSPSAGPGVSAESPARGAAFGDLNGDGRIEVVINNIDDRPGLLLNRGKAGNWIVVKLLGTKSNRNGIGARATVQAAGFSQLDEVRSGGSYISQNDMRMHFGLRDAETVDRILVAWPGGRAEAFGPFESNRQVLLVEGEGIGQPGH